MTDLSVIEKFDVALMSYFLTPANEPKLTNPVEVHDTINGSLDQQGYGPEWYPNCVLKTLPQRGVSVLTQIFNAVFRIPHFP